MNGQRYDIDLNVSDVPNLNLNVAETVNIIGGTTDYNDLNNKPQINSVELMGNKSFDDLGMSALSNMEIYNILT